MCLRDIEDHSRESRHGVTSRESVLHSKKKASLVLFVSNHLLVIVEVLAFLAFALLGTWKDGRVDARDNTSLSEVCIFADQLVELEIISDCEHDVARSDPLLLGGLSLVSSKFRDLRDDVLESRCEIDGSTTTNPVCVAALLHEASHARDAELKSSLDTSVHSSCRDDRAGMRSSRQILGFATEFGLFDFRSSDLLAFASQRLRRGLVDLWKKDFFRLRVLVGRGEVGRPFVVDVSHCELSCVVVYFKVS